MDLDVRMSKSYSSACEMLPKEIKSKLQKVQRKLYSEERDNGLHFEPVQNSDFSSVRIDQNYRIILKKEDPIIVLLYADKHDAAYDWASRHTFEINTETGGVELKGTVPPKASIDKTTKKRVSRLARLTDEQFIQLNIQKEYWEILRTSVFLKKQLLAYSSIMEEEAELTLEQILDGDDIESALEFYSQLKEPAPTPKVEERKEVPCLFESCGTEDLLKVGVPAEYIDLIRTIKTEDDLKRISKQLPETAVQSLYALSNGESVENIYKLTFTDSKPVDDDDLMSALENPVSRSSVTKVSDYALLESLTDAPLEQWRVFLHPSQQRIVERHYAGPARVIGGAGTGKTVVVIHRAKFLAQKCDTDEKILVTTYTRTLAEDIKNRLNVICTQRELAHIDVLTVDALAGQLSGRINCRIQYHQKYGYGKLDLIDSMWDKSLNASGLSGKYSLDFCRDEWQDVIQAQLITTKEEYLNVRRGSRGKRLDKRSREELWPVFEKYKQQCIERHKADIDYVENQLASYFAHQDTDILYKSILIDECQDFRAPAFRFLRAIAGEQHEEDMYLSGDSRQRIYGGQVSLSQCGIVINNRSAILKLNYRTTAEINEAASRLQREYQYDDLDGSIIEKDNSICVLHGPKPTVHGFRYERQELDALSDELRKKFREGVQDKDICVLARTGNYAKKAELELNKRSIETLRLDNEQSDDRDISGVRVATMHRVKGMEFSYVYIIFANGDIVPPKGMMKNLDGDELQDILKQEANLLAMSMTRAKREVWISYNGQPSRYLDHVSDEK